jgi:glycosyltransferase involved in cell wall biosynthesis
MRGDGKAFNETESLRVCVVAENASFQFGGEASLPLHYYSRLRARGVEAWLVVHGRTREELEALFPNDKGRILFIPDQWFHRLIWRFSRYLPRRISQATFGTLMVLVNQCIQRQMILRLIAKQQINVVHQPIPVSPMAPSFICGLGVPVVMGPLNGGMDYPPAFRGVESWLTRVSVRFGRYSANLVNRLIPGKKLADFVLVANERTRAALPACVTGDVIEVPENGVDLDLWSFRPELARDCSGRFLFLGRLVDWKRLDLALEALARVPGAHLDVIGDGPMRGAWTQLAAELNVADRVNFLGWMPQAECAQRLQSATALLLPSIYECGGAVVLEAMGMGVPVVAVEWGGPADYVDASCGMLIPPDSVNGVVEGFAGAMRTLIERPDLRFAMGEASRQKIEAQYGWEDKVDRILDIFRQAVCRESFPTDKVTSPDTLVSKYQNLV